MKQDLIASDLKRVLVIQAIVLNIEDIPSIQLDNSANSRLSEFLLNFKRFRGLTLYFCASTFV